MNPKVNGAVIMNVRTSASGSTPEIVMLKTRTTTKKTAATASTTPKKNATRRAQERRFKTTTPRPTPGRLTGGYQTGSRTGPLTLP